MVDNVVILAGGSGTRLWPASIRKWPKQFLDPGTGKSLLQMTIQRAAAIGTRGSIIIVTHDSQVEGILQQALELETVRGRIVVMPEPQMRNTAPALGFAVAYMKNTGAIDETTLVLAADHLISPVDKFGAAVEKADQLAREGYLVTFGIRPDRPETGYGYIEAGEPHGPGCLVKAFKEKPDVQTAQSYVDSGSFFWNSGMFVFRNSTLHSELSQYEPAIAAAFDGVHSLPYEQRRTALPELNREGITVAWKSGYVDHIYADLPKISIDYAVMERSTKTAMVETDFAWNDIGSWDEMAQLTEAGLIGSGEANSLTGMTRRAPVFSVESANNYVYSELPVALCGVEDIMVIVKNGRVLVARRGSGQLVKDAVEQMSEREREDLR